MGSTQPMWVVHGWGWTYVMSWFRLNFFLTHHGGLGKKIPLTRPNLIHAHTYIKGCQQN